MEKCLAKRLNQKYEVRYADKNFFFVLEWEAPQTAFLLFPLPHLSAQTLDYSRAKLTDCKSDTNFTEKQLFIQSRTSWENLGKMSDDTVPRGPIEAMERGKKITNNISVMTLKA